MMDIRVHRLWAGTVMILAAVVMRSVWGGNAMFAGLVLIGSVAFLMSFAYENSRRRP